MKFDNHEYWKHDNCVDAFFMVCSVAFYDGQHARLYGHWFVQGIHNHWMASEYEPISIKSKDYNKWKPYTPLTKQRFG